MVAKQYSNTRSESEEGRLTERVVQIRRVTKVVAGGRRLRFTALVVVGDQDGHVGAGLGKASAVPDAVRKGTTIARRSLLQVRLRGTTIPHEIVAKFGASKVLLKPARPGTGIIAGNAVRAVLELAGVTDVVTKALGSSNPINVTSATMKALAGLKDPEQELAKRLKLANQRTR